MNLRLPLLWSAVTRSFFLQFLKKRGCLKNLFKFSTRTWNLDSASLRRLGVTSIYAEDIIFEGAKNGIFYSTVVKIKLANTFAIKNLLQKISLL